MKKICSTYILACISLFFISCGQQQSTSDHDDHHHDHDHDHHEGIQWEALTALDLETEHASAKLEDNPEEALKHIPEIKALASALLDGEPPKDIHHREEVMVLLDDLKSLVASLDEPSGNPSQTVAAFHPLIAEIMETAGIPHRHDH